MNNNSPINSENLQREQLLETVHHAELHSPIGLIAGNGSFPIEFAKNAAKRGLKVIAAAHLKETNPELVDLVEACTWVRVGQLGRMIRLFKKHGVRQVVFLGGIARIKTLTGIRPDWRAVRVISRARSVRDDGLLREIAREFESCGLEVISGSVLLHESVAKAGSLTKRTFTEQERKDAVLGWQVAKDLGRWDIGQSGVVAGGIVISLEGVDGTDALISRSGPLCKKAAVLVKVSKPEQDLRLDLPTVGPATILGLKKSGIGALALESERCLIVDPITFVTLADQAGIAIEVFERL